jgi:hypothetical protein
LYSVLSYRTLSTVRGMSRRPARERATAPERRLDVLESFGKELDDDPGVGEMGEMRAALVRMALSEVK